MNALLNGKTAEIEERSTIHDLVHSRHIDPEAVVVALNDKVIKRDRWMDTVIREGDCLEIVSLVGGG